MLIDHRKYPKYPIAKLLFKYAIKSNIYLDLNQQDASGNYPLLEAIYHNKTGMIKLFFDYSRKCNLHLMMNSQNNAGDYPLLHTVTHHKLYIFKLILEYAYERHIILDLNAKDNEGNYPILQAIIYDYYLMEESIIQYAREFHLELEINESNSYGDYPLLKLLENYNQKSTYNINIIKLLLKYSREYQIPLQINKQNKYKNIKESYPIFLAMYNRNGPKQEIINLLVEYALEYRINLIIPENNECFKYYDCADYQNILNIIKQSNYDIVKYILNYVEDRREDKSNCQRDNLNFLNDFMIDEHNYFRNYLLPIAIYYQDEHFVGLLLKYIREHSVNIAFNEQDIYYGNNPLLMAIENNHLGIVQMLLEYADQHKINILLNETNDSGVIPLERAIENKNKKITSLLIDYADKHNIDLNSFGRVEFLKKKLMAKEDASYQEIIQLLVDYLEKENQTIKVYFEKPNYWKYHSEVMAYIYHQDEDDVKEIHPWPGVKMNSINESIYSISVPNQYRESSIIFSENGQNQIPYGIGTPGFAISVNGMYNFNGLVKIINNEDENLVKETAKNREEIQENDESTISHSIYYYSGWNPAFIYYQDRKNHWTDYPGIEMTLIGKGYHKVVLKEWEEPLTFVFNDGHHHWDNNNSQNYTIEYNGSNLIENGQIKLLDKHY
jgi:ankyrin repeat protein